MTHILSVTSPGDGTCNVRTTAGRFEHWPGRELADGTPWWSFTSDTHGPTVVTVPETIRWLENLRSSLRHPSAQPVRHLHVVPSLDGDPTPPHGIVRPAVGGAA